MKHLIIGNSAAAVGCVEGIRRQSAEDEILILENEGRHTYSRPLISYLLAGKTDARRMRYRPDDFYEKNAARRVHATATAIDPIQKLVFTQAGERYPYDRLLVATGAAPAVFPLPGLEQVKRQSAFTTLDDAEYLMEAVTPATRVFILGAGLIGLKCAEGLRARAGQITVCDLAPAILSSILGPGPAALMQKHLEQNGVAFQLGTGVARFCAVDGHCEALLQNGARVPFDQLVLAAGVRPNVGLVKEAGGIVNRGIVADAYGRTSLPDIYAAGDCTESTDAATGEKKVMALLPNAYLQGEAAGRSMSAGKTAAEPCRLIPMNAIGFFGKHILSAGVYEADSDAHIYESGSEGAYRCFYRKGGRLAGFILIDAPERAGIYTALVRDGTELREEQFEQLLRAPGLLAFDPAVRAGILRQKQEKQESVK